MNLSTFFVILLAGVSAVLASAGKDVSQITGDDISHIDRIIAQGDHPNSLVERFFDRRLEYSTLTHHMLFQMLGNGRNKMFKAFFAQFTFTPKQVDSILAPLLEAALGLGNIEICDFLLSHKFKFNANLHGAWSIQYRNGSAWDLEAFKKLVQDYPAIAAVVCPSPLKSYDKFDATEILFLIKFAHFCATLSQNSSKPATFDHAAWIVVANKKQFSNGERRMLNGCLSGLGVNVDRSTIDNALRNAPFYSLPASAYGTRALQYAALEPFPDYHDYSVAAASVSNTASPISLADLSHVDQAIRLNARNVPEGFIGWFGDRRLRYSSIVRCRLVAMIHINKPNLFKSFLERLDLDHADRIAILSDLLSVALNFGNVDICDFLLARNFKYVPSHEGPWRRRFRYTRLVNDLDEFKKLVRDYPQIAAAICPSNDQLYEMYDSHEIIFLFRLARFCAKASQNHALFNPSAWIRVVNQKRFIQATRDDLIFWLCGYGAELDQGVIEKVQRNALMFYKTYDFLRARHLIDPASPPFPVDATGFYRLQERDYKRLGDAMFGGEIPNSIFELLRDCRFEPSGALRDLFLRLISHDRPIESFYFFFDRIQFVLPDQTDRTFAYLLDFAISHNRMDIFGFLIGQDFNLIDDQHDIFFHLEAENVQAVANLLLGYPEKAAALAPTGRSLEECFDAELAYLLIDLARRLNPAGFDPTGLLRGLVQNRNIEDGGMAELIEHLCKMGAAVEAQTFGLLEQDYAKSHETLRYYEEQQKEDIKEPGMN